PPQQFALSCDRHCGGDALGDACSVANGGTRGRGTVRDAAGHSWTCRTRYDGHGRGGDVAVRDRRVLASHGSAVVAAWHQCRYRHCGGHFVEIVVPCVFSWWGDCRAHRLLASRPEVAI